MGTGAWDYEMLWQRNVMFYFVEEKKLVLQSSF